MKTAIAVGLGFMVFAISSPAQESLAGKYSGVAKFESGLRGTVLVSLTLEITTAAEGKLEGKVTAYSNGRIFEGCAGDYKLQGTYEGSKLVMLSEVGGLTRDCRLRFDVVAEGKKLTGMMGKSPVELSK